MEENIGIWFENARFPEEKKRWIESRFFETFAGRESSFEIEFVDQLRQLWNCQWRSIQV